MKENLNESSDDSFNEGLSNSFTSDKSPAKTSPSKEQKKEEVPLTKKLTNKKKPVQRAKTMVNKELDFGSETSYELSTLAFRHRL